MVKETLTDEDNLAHDLHSASTLLFLYHTKPDSYGPQILALQYDITETVAELFAQQREKEVFPAIGPLLLSELIPALPPLSPLADYVRLLVQLEPEDAIPSRDEIISTFDHIVVFVGNKASGKGTISSILQDEYAVSGIANSDWLREIAHARGLTPPYDSIMLRELGDEFRAQFGGDVLMWLTMQEGYLKGSRNIAFDGLRTEAELQKFMGRPNASLFWIEASDQKRLERVNNRNRPGDPHMTMDDLLVVDRRSFPEADILRSRCQFTITNESDDLEGLKQTVASFFDEIGIKPPKIAS